MIVSAIQFETGGKEVVLDKGLSLIQKALRDKPDLIVLQELFNTIYFPQHEKKEYFGLAEKIPGITTQKVEELIRGRNTAVIAPIFEKDIYRYFCSAAVVDSDKGLVGTYRKIHIPTVEKVHEPFYFQGGDLGHTVFEVRGARIGIMLCYDRHFPESARLYGLREIDLLCVCSATPKSAAWPWFFEMQAHAFSNCYALACANRAGTEDGIDFLGSSFISSHKGEILARCGEDGDRIIMADIDLSEIRESKKKLAFYRDRRPDQYDGIATMGSYGEKSK
jgi:predicted amidohydrolase